jgi:hypothetical protein
MTAHGAARAVRALTALDGETEHNVYFNEFDMLLEPQDDQPGYVVGDFRRNEE